MQMPESSQGYTSACLNIYEIYPITGYLITK